MGRKMSKDKDDESHPLKLYVALFVCASTRAAHIEVVPAMTTNQTHLALRRFLSSYPACTKMISEISDNARSFVRAATDLKGVFNSCNNKEVRELLATQRIEWTLI